MTAASCDHPIETPVPRTPLKIGTAATSEAEPDKLTKQRLACDNGYRVSAPTQGAEPLRV
jgi:hypothetical protein